MENPHFDFSHLTPAERIQLAQDLLDSVWFDVDDLPFTEEERAELDRRLQAFRQDPKAGSS